MAQAKDGDNVKIHYTGTLEGGVVFDSSKDREPLEFTLGQGAVIPGFEQGVLGMAEGDKKTINIPCAEAYGDRNEELIYQVPKTDLPEGVEPEPGMSLEAQGPEGQVFRLTVAEVQDETVTLDGNHPLAGADLTFELELVSIG